MLVIIEGPDKAGKTTLAQAVEAQGYEYVHFGFPGPDPAAEYIQFLLDLDRPTVTDRFYFGELIYGPLLRGGSKISPLQQTVIERLCRLRGAIFIYANTPLKICQRRLRENLKNEKITIKQNAEAWKGFSSLVPSCNVFPLVFYGSSCYDSINDILDYISFFKNYATRALEAKKICTGLGTIIGKKYVLVGEAMNENGPGFKIPFNHGPASEYLNTSLITAKAPEKKIYVCNADKLTAAEAAFLDDGSPITWISLGSKADQKLKELKIESTRVPHPQWWNRFHHYEKKAYTILLKEALK